MKALVHGSTQRSSSTDSTDSSSRRDAGEQRARRNRRCSRLRPPVTAALSSRLRRAWPK